MILGLTIAIFAYFLNAITTIVDKYLLRRSVPSPISYGFYMGILSIFALPLFIFGFEYPGFLLLLFDFLAGFVFLISILLMYVALKNGEASRVMPIIGGLTPILLYVYETLIAKNHIGSGQLVACSLLIAGSILISMRIKNNKKHQQRIHFESLGIATLSAFFLAGYFILIDQIYTTQVFIAGFVWTRIGSFLGALLLLSFQKNRKKIFITTKKIKLTVASIVISNKIIAGIAFILLNLAVAKSSGLIVNSLNGTQYVFLFLMIIILSYKYPKIIKEKFNKWVIWQKSLALVLVGMGLVLLFIAN
ncbi:MAG: EamA family transporter [Patescibacteria group bacterium]|nr:EamA family transporter [Patescibacteria group bacterium]